MKLSELNAKSEKELMVMINEKKGALFGLKLQLSVGQLAKTADIRNTKKDIARIFTCLKAKKK